MKQPANPTGSLTTAVVLLVVLAAITPAVIALADALLPMAIVLVIGAIAIRLVFTFTRGW